MRAYGCGTCGSCLAQVTHSCLCLSTEIPESELVQIKLQIISLFPVTQETSTASEPKHWQPKEAGRRKDVVWKVQAGDFAITSSQTLCLKNGDNEKGLMLLWSFLFF